MRKTTSISSLPRAAAIGVMALLFAVSAQQPASATSATSEACTALGNLADDSRKPQDLDVRSPAPVPDPGFNISWSIPDAMPRDVLTGHCVHKTHVDTGSEERACNTAWPQATAIGWNSCYHDSSGDLACYGGVHRLKVKFTTNCGIELPYSDSVDYTYGTYTP